MISRLISSYSCIYRVISRVVSSCMWVLVLYRSKHVQTSSRYLERSDRLPRDHSPPRGKGPQPQIGWLCGLLWERKNEERRVIKNFWKKFSEKEWKEWTITKTSRMSLYSNDIGVRICKNGVQISYQCRWKSCFKADTSEPKSMQYCSPLLSRMLL